MRKNLPSQSGQVVLIILLVISVILVVGLSVVSRSVTDIKISQQSQESARALWVAQAGLEKAIRTNAAIDRTEEGNLNVTYSVGKDDIGEGDEFVFPAKIEAGEYVSFWFLPRDEAGNLITSFYTGPRNFTIGWGESEKCALEATIIYSSSNKFYSKRYIYGPSSFNGKATNFAAPPSGTILIGDKTLQSKTDLISLPSGTPYVMQLRLLFNTSPQSIGIVSNDPGKIFPKQGSCYTSTAIVMESGVTRKLEQCELWPTVPSIFNYLLFSGGSITGGGV